MTAFTSHTFVLVSCAANNQIKVSTDTNLILVGHFPPRTMTQTSHILSSVSSLFLYNFYQPSPSELSTHTPLLNIIISQVTLVVVHTTTNNIKTQQLLKASSYIPIYSALYTSLRALIRILMRVNIIPHSVNNNNNNYYYYNYIQQEEDEQEVRVSELFNTLLFTQQQEEEEEEEQEVRVSELFNTLLFTQQQQEEQEVRLSELFNTLLFTQQQEEEEEEEEEEEQEEEQEEQEVRVSELFNTLLFTQQQQEEEEVRVSELFNTLLFTHQQGRSSLSSSSSSSLVLVHVHSSLTTCPTTTTTAAAVARRRRCPVWWWQCVFVLSMTSLQTATAQQVKRRPCQWRECPRRTRRQQQVRICEYDICYEEYIILVLLVILIV